MPERDCHKKYLNMVDVVVREVAFYKITWQKKEI